MLGFITESLECITPLLLLRTPRVTHPKAHERPQEELGTGKCSFSLTSIHDKPKQESVCGGVQICLPEHTPYGECLLLPADPVQQHVC